MDAGSHWDNIYRTKGAADVSWYRPHLDRSLALIESAAPERSSRIIDVGGGESTLVDDLLAKGYEIITVLDISLTALTLTKQRLGALSDRVRWICADVTEFPLMVGACDVWHDRAVFHFLNTVEERAAYVSAMTGAVIPGGHVIISTFGPQGPARCSGLPVRRYSPEDLVQEFGPRFQLMEHSMESHETPSGASQQFLYCLFRRY